MKKIKRKCSYILMCAVIVFTGVFMTACSGNSIKLSSFKTDDVYQYENAKWGVSPDGAAKTLPYTIKENKDLDPGDGRFVVYQPEEYYPKLQGYSSTIRFEFPKEKLGEVQLSVWCDKDERQKCFDKIKDEAVKLYGEPDKVSTPDNGNTKFIWQIDKTYFHVTLMEDNTKRYKDDEKGLYIYIVAGDLSQYPDHPLNQE